MKLNKSQTLTVLAQSLSEMEYLKSKIDYLVRLIDRKNLDVDDVKEDLEPLMDRYHESIVKTTSFISVAFSEEEADIFKVGAFKDLVENPLNFLLFAIISKLTHDYMALVQIRENLGDNVKRLKKYIRTVQTTWPEDKKIKVGNIVNNRGNISFGDNTINQINYGGFYDE